MWKSRSDKTNERRQKQKRLAFFAFVFFCSGRNAVRFYHTCYLKDYWMDSETKMERIHNIMLVENGVKWAQKRIGKEKCFSALLGLFPFFEWALGGLWEKSWQGKTQD